MNGSGLAYSSSAFDLLQIMELGGRDVRKKLAELQLGRDRGAVCKSPECSSPERAKPLITTRINNLKPFSSLGGRKSGLLCLQSVCCCAVAGGSSEGSRSSSGPQCVSYSRWWCGILFAPPLGNQSIPSTTIISTTLPRCANWSGRCLILLKPGLFWEFNFYSCCHSEGLWPRTRPPRCTWHCTNAREMPPAPEHLRSQWFLIPLLKVTMPRALEL